MEKFSFYIAFALFFFSCTQETTRDVEVESSIALDSLKNQSKEVNQMIQPYKIMLDSNMNKVIGEAALELKNEQKRGESSLGNFVADLMFYQANQMHSDTVHFSLINAHGGLRVPINKGEITVRNIFELMPFDNEILLLNVSGKEVEHIVQHTASDCRNVLSPVRFEIKNNQAYNISLNGQAIDTSKMYTLAISDYLANGGGGFDFLKDNKRTVVGIKLRDMIIQHIEELSSKEELVHSELDGRIIMDDVQ